jgi:endonuclease-3
MVAASRAKASDRSALLKKLLPVIKKHYKIHIPKGNLPVLETMVYAICLEDSSVEQAEESFKRLFTNFPDLNEVRVSSVGEIEPAFEGQTSPEWRAFRVISVLKFIFDKTYSFEFEGLRKKTLDLATKQLSKIKELSQFVRDYTLHEVTGAHLIAVDGCMARFLAWLGLALPNQSAEQMGEVLKGAIRKADVQTFLFTLRCVAVDPSLQVAFEPQRLHAPEGGFDLDGTAERLSDLLTHGPAKATKAVPKKVVPVTKSAAKKPTKAKPIAKKIATKAAKKVSK